MMKTEARQIQDYLEISWGNNPEEIIDRISTLSVYMARTGEMLAEAKRLYNRKVTSEIGTTIIKIAKEQFLSATAQNALVKSIAEEEQFLVDWIERMHRSCVHQIESLRSSLSFEKENLRITKTGY